MNSFCLLLQGFRRKGPAEKAVLQLKVGPTLCQRECRPAAAWHTSWTAVQCMHGACLGADIAAYACGVQGSSRRHTRVLLVGTTHDAFLSCLVFH